MSKENSPQNTTIHPSWSQYQQRLFHDPGTGFSLDTSRLSYTSEFLNKFEPRIQAALLAMQQLEAGTIANPDENRMVGHYWLRAPELAPNREITQAIKSTLESIKGFAARVHSGSLRSSSSEIFEHLIVIGIGGSALGPQFVTHALSNRNDKLSISFLDNTDPDGMQRALVARERRLNTTLVVVISKSGGTKETRNGMLVVKDAFTREGVKFNQHFVAVTGAGSELDKLAKDEAWLERFPMWDWVGGRTSEFSAVGLLPMALQGFSVDQVLEGAAAMDRLTRRSDIASNPAAQLAIAWYHCGCGRGAKDMVILPYKDRLELFSRYLQQLVMESLGKEFNLSGERVNQGLAVYGNKGSTDQHAYVQQLRDGINNFFVVFIEVLRDSVANKGFIGGADRLQVEPGITSGDYLLGFYLGTREALYEKGRESITVTIKEVSEFSVGMLVALFERAVGLYANLIGVNAYHQPGVEAGKRAAGEILKLKQRVVACLKMDASSHASAISVAEIATRLGEQEGRLEEIFKILRYLVENKRVEIAPGDGIFNDRYWVAVTEELS
jgi:glucose-6-phosphate isomerase